MKRGERIKVDSLSLRCASWLVVEGQGLRQTIAWYRNAFPGERTHKPPDQNPQEVGL